MYTAISVLLTAFFVFITVSGEKKHSGKVTVRRVPARTLLILNAVLAALGIICLAVTVLTAYLRVKHGGFEADFSSWALDMLSVYYKLTLIPLIAVMLLLLLSGCSAITDKKQRVGVRLYMRLALSIAVSLAVMLVSAVYSAMTVNGRINLQMFILFSGIGEAFIMRLSTLVDYAVRMKEEGRIPVKNEIPQ